MTPQEYVQQLSKQYQERIQHLDEPPDAADLMKEFKKEINWFKEQMSTTVELVKDKSLKSVARQAVKEVTDVVQLYKLLFDMN